MKPEVKCEHCLTTLQFEDHGKRFIFKAHDDAFCFVLTKHRVKLMEEVLVEQRESFERHIKVLRRQVDEMLSQRGMPSLAEQAAEAEAIARVQMGLP